MPLRYIDELEGKRMDVTAKTSRVIRAEVELNVGVHKSNENKEKKVAKKSIENLKSNITSRGDDENRQRPHVN